MALREAQHRVMLGEGAGEGRCGHCANVPPTTAGPAGDHGPRAPAPWPETVRLNG